MQVKLNVGEQGRNWLQHMGSPEETRLLIQGRSAFLDYTPEAHKEAERLWGEAFDMNPEGGMTNLVQGWLHQQKLLLGLSRSPMISVSKARMHADKAFGIMGDGNSLSLKGFVEMIVGNCEAAIEQAERAVEIDPSAGTALAMSGAAMINCMGAERGVVLLARAMRLEPNHRAFYPNTLSLGLLYLGRIEEAEEIATGVISSNPERIQDRLPALARLAAVNVFKGDTDKANEYINQILEIRSTITITTLRRNFMTFADKEFVERYLDALSQAGLPE